MWWSWILSAVGLLGLWLLGNKSYWGFIVGFIADILWLVYSLQTHQWGFVPACFIYAVVHIRNLKKWKARIDPNA